MRGRFFKPQLTVESSVDVNSWLQEQCVQYARVHPHPGRRDCPAWEMFEQKRFRLVLTAGRFDGFNARTATVSKTCLVTYTNRPKR